MSFAFKRFEGGLKKNGLVLTGVPGVSWKRPGSVEAGSGCFSEGANVVCLCAFVVSFLDVERPGNVEACPSSFRSSLGTCWER